MRLRSRKREKAIRRLVREELRSSPKLLREFNRRRRARIMERALTLGVWGLLVVALACVFPVMGRLAERDESETVLVLFSLVASGLCMGRSGVDISEPGGLPLLWLGTVGYYPVGDGQILKLARKCWTAAIFLVATWFSWVCCDLAVWSQQPVPWGHVFAVGLGLLQGSLAATIYLRLAKLPDEHDLKVYVGAGGFLILLVSFWMMFTIEGRDSPAQWLTCVAFFLGPLGWANGALYWGLLEGHVVAFLLLIPPVTLLVYLVHRIRTNPWWVETFFFDGDKLAESLLRYQTDPEKDEGTVIDRAPPSIPQAALTRKRMPEATSVTAVERRLLGRAWLDSEEMSITTEADKSVAAILTSRERLLVEYLQRGNTVLTRHFVAMLSLLACFALASLLDPAPKGSGDGIPLQITLVVALVSLGPRQSGYHVLFPIGFHEVSRALFKVGLMKCVWFFPLTLGYALIVGASCGASLPDPFVYAAIPLAVYVGWLPLSITLVFRPLVVEASPWRYRLSELITLILALAASLGALLPFGIGRIVFLAVLFGATGSLLACSARLFRGARHADSRGDAHRDRSV